MVRHAAVAILLVACSSTSVESGHHDTGGGAAVGGGGQGGVGQGGAGQGGGGGGAGDMPTPRLNQVRAKASHNSYERMEGLFDQLMYHRVHALELDIHISKGSSWPAVAGNWYVFHDGPGDPTTCHRLSDCLVELAAFHDAAPQHELITVFVDLKDDWATDHMPEDLDARIAARLSPSELVTPDSLMAACPGAADLRDAVAGACGWPELSALRGKIAFALTGGGGCNPTSKLTQYVEAGATALDRLAFIAPEPSTDCNLADYAANRRHVLFFNLPAASAALATETHNGGVLARVWDLNDEASWTVARAAKAQFLATDKVNLHQDPWATTHGSKGWPFRCIDPGCVEPPGDDADLITVAVDSGDMWGTADNGVFLYEQLASTSTTSTTGFVSVASSHVQEFAKGCLVARAALGPASASFAVCRPADVHPIRVQIRPSSGADTTATEVAINAADTIDDDCAAMLRLTVAPAGGGSLARGYASQDGSGWTLIAEHTFAVALPYQGIAASGHDSAVHMLFGGLRRSVDQGAEVPLSLAELSSQQLLGNASATVLDGWQIQ